MKALIRNEGETVTEDMGVEGIDWTTGAPLTNEAWSGGRYTLVEDYVPPTVSAPASYTVVETEEIVVEGDTVVIDGKEYTKEELRALLGE